MRFLTLLALAAAACVSADPIPESFRQNGWFVGSQAYTFKEFSFFEAIAKTKEAGGNVIELFPGQSVKPGSKEKTHHSMSAETMAEIKAEQDKMDAVLMGSYATEADLQRAYAFIERSGVDGTPSLVVNGKYRIIGGKTYADRLNIVDRLIAQERAARRPAARAKR